MELYRSSNLLVREVRSAERSRYVITFDNHSIGHGHNRLGFAEQHLRDNGISAVHVLGRGNDWYQYADLPKALAVVRSALATADRRITYGSSMGGFAAIRFAAMVGADAALALSPQYSNDPVVVPWERRWLQDARRIIWLPDLRTMPADSCSCVVVHDPTIEGDREHARLLAAEARCVLLPVRHAGHPVGTMLAETGLLDRLLRSTLDDTLDPPALLAALRRRARTSSVLIGELAGKQPPHRERTAIALGRRAVEIAGGPSLAMLSLARILSRAGEHDEALDLHRDLVGAGDRAAMYLVPYADALSAAGHRSLAASVAREVVDAEPRVAHLRNWLARLSWEEGKRLSAIGHQARAVALDPRTSHYATQLVRYLFNERIRFGR